jgi:hypothetical protein
MNLRVMGDLTLSWPGGLQKPDRLFANQLLEIEPETRSGRIGLDGRLYVSNPPRKFIWYGGSLEMLRDVVHVRISSGQAGIIEGFLRADKLLQVNGGIGFELRASMQSGDQDPQ